MYSTVRVVKSLVRTDHCAAAHTDSSQIPQTAVQKTYQPLSPFQHASYLHYISNLDFPSLSCDAQQGFDVLYELATSLLIFYPVRTITVSSRDPNFVTPFIKAKLRHKNRLVRKGKIEMANALAVQVSNDITRQNKKRYSSLNSKSGPKSLWSAVRQLTGTKRNMVHVEGITADSLNTHYASVSTDSHYLQPHVSPPVPRPPNRFSQSGLFFVCLTNFPPPLLVLTLFQHGSLDSLLLFSVNH